MMVDFTAHSSANNTANVTPRYSNNDLAVYLRKR